MPSTRKLILISVLILAVWFIAEYLMHGLIGEYFPNAPLKVSGFIVTVGIFVLFNIVFRIILRNHPGTSIASLVATGSIIVLLSEIIFQTYRQLTFTDITTTERVRYFVFPVMGLTLLSTLIAFGEAMDIKYKKRWLNAVILIGYFVILYVMTSYFDFFSVKN